MMSSVTLAGQSAIVGVRSDPAGDAVDYVTESLEGALAELMVRLLGAGASSWATTELTMPQLKMLLLLTSAGSASISWLAAQTCVSTPNITGIIDRMEERRLVQRRMDAHDRRVVQVSLTDRGRAELREGCRRGVAAVAAALASLQPQEALMLRAGIAALMAAIDKQAAPALTLPDPNVASTRPGGLDRSGDEVLNRS